MYNYNVQMKCIRNYGVIFMKKRSVIVIMCIILVITGISAVWGINSQNGYDIVFNGEKTEYVSEVIEDVHYVPMRQIFEKFGASVFYKSSDNQILALSRDGDMIRHTIGENIITVNGEKKSFDSSSVLKDGTTYIPMDMVSVAFVPDEVSYDNKKLSIQKQVYETDYHKIIKDVLDVSKNGNFYAERFQRYINYHEKKPSYSMQDVLFRVNLGLDYPFYQNVSVIAQPHELLVLVNKYNQLPSDFKQYNLVNMKKEHTVNDGKVYLLAGVAYDNFIQMFNAAKKQGLSLLVLSAHRTEAYQKYLYDNKVRSAGKVYADNYSARPGFSEHQTGLAVDITSVETTFENTAEFRWLQKHAHEYGFILRYPKGKEWITGYSYEPWHYRYVGTDAAKKIYEEGITYEEYYAKYVSVNEFR